MTARSSSTVKATHVAAVSYRQASDHFDTTCDFVPDHSVRDSDDPYTEADIDAHSAAIESMAAAFDGLTKCFSALIRDNEIFSKLAEIYALELESYLDKLTEYNLVGSRIAPQASEAAVLHCMQIADALVLRNRGYKPNEANLLADRLQSYAEEGTVRAEALCNKVKSATGRANFLLDKATNLETISKA